MPRQPCSLHVQSRPWRPLRLCLHGTPRQWEEVDDPGLAYRRSCGINIKRYNGTLPVRDFNRGLNTLVFVPWEHADDHVLNNSAEEMDFFVTG